MKKNVADQEVTVQMTNRADGSPFTGTATCYVRGKGGTLALGSVGSGVASHEGGGLQKYIPSRAETNYDTAQYQFRGAGAITVTVHASMTTDLSRESADSVAARVNDHRGEFYPNAKQVWVLKRGAAGLEVKDDFQIVKGEAETLRVYIDFASVMGRNEFVDSIESLALNGGTATIVADSANIVGNLVYFDITGGVDDDNTTVEFEVLSTEGQTISGQVCEFIVVE